MDLHGCDPTKCGLTLVGALAYHAAYSALEYWLGRTKKTGANSVAELVLMCAAALLSKGMKNGRSEPSRTGSDGANGDGTGG